ncbi:MAG: hypothetical protein K9M57_03130, partial [Phycisphaerae bacterium]|nr:hypothetical protein [Phycisphaerae bacterium]
RKLLLMLRLTFIAVVSIGTSQKYIFHQNAQYQSSKQNLLCRFEMDSSIPLRPIHLKIPHKCHM